MWVISLLLVIGLLLAGCSGSGSAQHLAASGKTYKVSAELQEFYTSLGGEALLGPAISKLVDNPAGKCQYTVNVLICENPMLTGNGRFSLSPIGNELNLHEEPGVADAMGTTTVNGYTIYDEFLPLYNQLSGTTYAGNPIAPVHLNYARERIEQYFENVGLYRNFSDPPGTVKLLAYGTADCARICSYHPASEASLANDVNIVANESLINDLKGLSDTKPFGKPLTQPFKASDGNEEQAYEGIVLYRNINNGSVSPRPMATLLNMLSTDPGEKKYGSDNGMVFYAVKDNLGYHVPVLFDQFISAHGGTAVSGDPIAEVIEYLPGVFRQCFTNYCLDYTPSASKDKRVTVATLGSQYLQLQQKTTPSQPTTEPEPGMYTLQLSEAYNPLPDTQAQRIDIILLNAADQKPAPGIQTSLVLNLPDGTSFKAMLPLTGDDGTASIVLPLMNKIPNGSILTYQVCVENAGKDSDCKNSSYLAWTAP
jgi:hypothetical protein